MLPVGVINHNNNNNNWNLENGVGGSKWTQVTTQHCAYASKRGKRNYHAHFILTAACEIFTSFNIILIYVNWTLAVHLNYVQISIFLQTRIWCTCYNTVANQLFFTQVYQTNNWLYTAEATLGLLDSISMINWLLLSTEMWAGHSRMAGQINNLSCYEDMQPRHNVVHSFRIILN